MTFADITKLPETLTALERRISALEKENVRQKADIDQRNQEYQVLQQDVQNAFEKFQKNIIHVVADQLAGRLK